MGLEEVRLSAKDYKNIHRPVAVEDLRGGLGGQINPSALYHQLE